MPRVNDLLYMACLAENFTYMDQDRITLAHLDADGLHPNFYGSTILKYNICSVFRTFNKAYMNFRVDLERELH